MNNTIEIKNLNKFYGKKQALCDVTLSIEQGMFGLLGRNGAGKTTLMRTLATLLPKRSGTVSICGIPIEKDQEVRKITGYLPQEFSMYPSMNVMEAMDYLALLSGLEKSARKERIELLLQKVNLTEHCKKKVKALSGGMKRRLGIAQALLNNPKVLIVDEPTAGLTPKSAFVSATSCQKSPKNELLFYRRTLPEISKPPVKILRFWTAEGSCIKARSTACSQRQTAACTPSSQTGQNCRLSKRLIDHKHAHAGQKRIHTVSVRERSAQRPRLCAKY